MYDQCFGDPDRDGGAPCERRASGSIAAANVCLRAGSCRIDSDCGPCDRGGNGTCNYDTLVGRWQCAECWPVP